MLGALLIVGWGEVRKMAASLEDAKKILAADPLVAAVIGSVLALILWVSWTPPHQYDSLVYHLALPQAYLRTGSLAPVEHLIFSHFPQNGEMLFALGLALGSDILAQLFMWLSSLLCLWWVFDARRFVPTAAARLGAVLLATHTAFLLLATTTYVEPLVALWTTASVLSFFRYHYGESSGKARGWLVISAIFCGLALGTKYYAGITAALLGSALLLRVLRASESSRAARASDLGLFVCLVTLLFTPWLIKNAVVVGNPVFPFFYQFFPMTGTGWAAESARGYFGVLTEYGHPHGHLYSLLRLPFLLLTNSPRFGGGMDVLGNLGWELTFWALPLGVWACRDTPARRGLLFFCGAYMTAWFCTGVVLRFLTVIAPLL